MQGTGACHHYSAMVEGQPICTTTWLVTLQMLFYRRRGAQNTPTVSRHERQSAVAHPPHCKGGGAAPAVGNPSALFFSARALMSSSTSFAVLSVYSTTFWPAYAPMPAKRTCSQGDCHAGSFRTCRGTRTEVLSKRLSLAQEQNPQPENFVPKSYTIVCPCCLTYCLS